jgi:ATP-binding protein involved in chromosome partitioning
LFGVRNLQGRVQRPRINQVEKVLVVGSGKGGVGKSTVSVNLAVALAKRGARVGLLDADAYGPSVPMMLGVRKRSASQGWNATLPLGQRGELSPEQMLKPLMRYGVEVMSVGFFIGEEQAVAPIPDVLGVLIRQLLYTVYWGPLDYLIIDLPPGNGEPQATLCRELYLDGAILVTTPQDIARIDTAKGLGMFQSAGVPVLGLVQNMSGFVCPHCGEHVDIFPASSEYRALLDELPLLGAIPLDPATAMSGDKGQPVVVRMPESVVAEAFGCIAEKVADVLGVEKSVINTQMPGVEDEIATSDEEHLDEGR